MAGNRTNRNGHHATKRKNSGDQRLNAMHRHRKNSGTFENFKYGSRPAAAAAASDVTTSSVSDPRSVVVWILSCVFAFFVLYFWIKIQYVDVNDDNNI